MMGIGLFRLVLALTVVITHTHSIWGFTLGNPVIAVRTFFIISGFYMSLVLNEKYNSNLLFWRNRFLKIYPVYWATLLLTIGSCFGAYWLRHNWGELAPLVQNIHYISIPELILILISHITILGRSFVMFKNVDFLLVPQAWTLVLELSFYILAPLILRKKRNVIVIAMFVSLLFRYWIKNVGLTGDLWEYRFFPCELIYFLLGWWSYQIYKYINLSRRKLSKITGLITLFTMVAALSIFNYLPVEIYLREWLFYILITLLLPFSFYSAKSSRWDNKIGELSYPVYIVHILVNNIIYPILFIPLFIDRNWQPIATFVFSITLSLFLIRFIQSPIDKIRAVPAKI